MEEYADMDSDTARPVPSPTPNSYHGSNKTQQVDPDKMDDSEDTTGPNPKIYSEDTTRPNPKICSEDTTGPNSKIYSQEKQGYEPPRTSKRSSRFRDSFNQVTSKLMPKTTPRSYLSSSQFKPSSSQQGSISNASVASPRVHDHDTCQPEPCVRCLQLTADFNRISTSYKRQLSDMTQGHGDKEKRIERLKSIKTMHEEQINNLVSDVATKNGEINTLKSQIASRDIQIDSLKSQVSRRDTQIDTLKSRVAKRDTQINDLKSEVATSKAQMEENIMQNLRQLETANQERDAERRRVDSLNSEIVTREAQVRALKYTISRTNAGNPDSVPDNQISSDYQYLISQLNNWSFSNFRRSKPTQIEQTITDFGLDLSADPQTIAAVNKCLTGNLSQKCLAIGMLVMWYLSKHVFERFLFGLEEKEEEFLYSLESNFAKTSTAKEINFWRSTTIQMLIATESHKHKVSHGKKEIASKLESILLDILSSSAPSNPTSWVENLKTIITQAVKLSFTLRVQRPTYLMSSPRPGDKFEDEFMESTENNMDDSDSVDSDTEDIGLPGGYPSREKSVKSVELSIFPALFKRGNEDGEKYEEEICIHRGKVLKA